MSSFIGGQAALAATPSPSSGGSAQQLYHQSAAQDQVSTAAVVACPRNAFCAYSDRGYQGIMQAFYGNNPNWDAWPALKNKDSSWANNHPTKSQKLYPDKNYKGSFMCFLPGTKDSDAWLEDDNTESNQFVQYSACL